MERVRRQGKGWHHADGGGPFVPAPFKTLGQFDVFPKNKLQPKKKNTKSSALNSEKFSTLARSNRNDCRWESFAAILHHTLFCVETQAGCQNNSGKETSLSYSTINLVFLTKRQIKWLHTQNTLERNSQTNSDKINFIGNLFIHMLQWLPALNVFTGEEVIVTCLHYYFNYKRSSHIVMSDLAISTYTMSTHTLFNNLLEHGTC
jgi:hypothetical protein